MEPHRGSAAPGTESARPVPAVPLHRPVAVQLAEAITAAGPGSDGSGIEITLATEELGQVRLSLHQGERGLTVQVQAERPETAELIRRHLPDLDRDLRDLGHGSVAFSFGDRPQQGREPPQADVFARDGDAARPVTAPRPAAPARGGTAGLDIRL